jgi:hypothetical protein
MAIIDAIPGLKAEVIVNNTPLQEYPDPDAAIDPKGSTAYIEAQSGRTFHVLTKFDDSFSTAYSFRLTTRLDGKKFSSLLMRAENLARPEGFKSVRTLSNTHGKWHKSRMLFSPLAVGKCPYRLISLRFPNLFVEEDSNANVDQATSDRLRKTGTITILLHQIENVSQPRKHRYNKKDIYDHGSGQEVVPEKAVQVLGLSHRGG